tara:strand:+ start:428 stop:796 length:369 start_codon:yes stop_codon:yes gene_type:complete
VEFAKKHARRVGHVYLGFLTCQLDQGWGQGHVLEIESGYNTPVFRKKYSFPADSKFRHFTLHIPVRLINFDNRKSLIYKVFLCVSLTILDTKVYKQYKSRIKEASMMKQAKNVLCRWMSMII